ncbi:putative zinc metalloprotease [Mycena latifolia]|nr:putative zinc metalloprotease [Mycena latifolia]
MQIVEGIAKVFAFRTLPTTILVVLVYGVLFGAVFLGNRLADVPENQNGLDLAQAYADLHHIAERPHPFISHANDIVHSYILDRVRNVTAGIEYVEVYEDLVSNASWPSWGSASTATYNEATNILVKIEGSDPEYASRGGVLFSAHYDSVSTASGTTDDGMGVATLIQLVYYLAKNRPKRTAVFNINNGEEDGLCGAFTFLKHPWSTFTDAFLNLEGAAAGGRPLLFRGTSTPALRSFDVVPHPHGNALSADAFSRGVIRSGTDYTVYTGAGMEGLDLAFYQGRSKYHTKYDAIPYTQGQEKALWAMMESAKASGVALLNNDRTHGSGSSPVYFDLFNAWLVIFSLDSLLVANIVLLIVGPVFLILMVVADAAILHGRSQNQNGHVPEHRRTLLQQFWTWLIELSWLKATWIWAKFWVAVLVTLGFQALLMFGYLKLNPFIVYSQPGLVVASSFTLTYLMLVFVMTPSSNHLPEKQKHIMLLQTYIFTWLLLIGATISVSSGIGGVYFISAWNAAVLLSCAIGCIENMLGAHGSNDVPHRLVRRARYDGLPQGDETHPSTADEADAEATEATPLIQSSSPPQRTTEESGAIGWWILQLILAVSVPVTLVGHIAVLLLGALAQTLSDGSSAATVYMAISALVFMMVLPVVPFTFKVHSGVATLFIVLFVFSTAASWLAFPFSQVEPLKVSFQQTIALGNISSPYQEITHATTTVVGLEGYVRNLVLPKLPSAIGKNIVCSKGPRIGPIEACSWNSTLLPSPGSYDSAFSGGVPQWLNASVTRLGENSARFVVGATNTRGCRLYFDNKRVKNHRVHGGEPGMLPQFSGPEEGVAELRLWSRTWDRTFTVDVEWEGDSTLEGRVACEWAEYESGSVGVPTTGKIPSLEEVLTFVPRWVAVTKMADGLVEAWGSFSI